MDLIFNDSEPRRLIAVSCSYKELEEIKTKGETDGT